MSCYSQYGISLDRRLLSCMYDSPSGLFPDSSLRNLHYVHPPLLLLPLPLPPLAYTLPSAHTHGILSDSVVHKLLTFICLFIYKCGQYLVDQSGQRQSMPDLVGTCISDLQSQYILVILSYLLIWERQRFSVPYVGPQKVLLVLICVPACLNACERTGTCIPARKIVSPAYAQELFAKLLHVGCSSCSR